MIDTTNRRPRPPCDQHGHSINITMRYPLLMSTASFQIHQPQSQCHYFCGSLTRLSLADSILRVISSHSSFPSLVPQLLQVHTLYATDALRTTETPIVVHTMSDDLVRVDIFCKSCRGTILHCLNPVLSVPEYGVLRCTVDECYHTTVICAVCDQRFLIRGNNF